MEKRSETLNFFSDLAVVHTTLQQNFEKLKQKLEDSHLTLEKLIAHMADGLIFVTLKGFVTLFNAAAEALTGYSQSEVLERTFWDNFPDSVFGFSMKKALEVPSTYHRVLLTLNETKEIEVTSSFVPERGLLILLRDRTELFQLEKNLRQGEQLKELGEMAARLAHEIRNPLAGIEGFSELLLRDIKEKTAQSMLKNILEGARIINRLVTNVLDYAKPFKLHFETLDLSLFIEDFMAALFLNFKQSSLIFEKKRSSFRVFADKDRLSSVFHNLIRNALEAGAQNIRILLEKEGVLRISDDGSGIARSNLDKIFSPFFTTKTSGTGLGLAEVYKVIQAHGGEISVCSEVKKGTTFSIKLREIYDN